MLAHKGSCWQRHANRIQPSQQNSLHAVIHRIQNVHSPAAIEHQCPGVEELARFAADAAPEIDELAIERELLYAVVSVFANVDVALAIVLEAIGILKLTRRGSLLAPRFD